MISTTNEYGEERSFKAKFISTRNRTILVSVKIISYGLFVHRNDSDRLVVMPIGVLGLMLRDDGYKRRI